MNDGGPKYPHCLQHMGRDGQTRHQSLAETAMASMLNAIDAQVYQMVHITAVAKVAHLVADAMLAEEERRAEPTDHGTQDNRPKT